MTLSTENLDYRLLLSEQLRKKPKQGHGQMAKLAVLLGVHPTLITQIFKGRKNLSAEHAFQICEYLDMGENETELILALIDLEKAGHFKLKKHLEQKVVRLHQRLASPQARVAKHTVLSESDQALFYSAWYYSAIRLSVEIGPSPSAADIAQRLGLEHELVQTVLGFLSKAGLVVVNGNDRYLPGPQRTYLPAESPLVFNHHRNWRLKAIQNFDSFRKTDLAFTGPITLSKKDFAKIRRELLDSIGRAAKIVKESESEILGCLSVDLFEIY